MKSLSFHRFPRVSNGKGFQGLVRRCERLVHTPANGRPARQIAATGRVESACDLRGRGASRGGDDCGNRSMESRRYAVAALPRPTGIEFKSRAGSPRASPCAWWRRETSQASQPVGSVAAPTRRRNWDSAAQARLRRNCDKRCIRTSRSSPRRRAASRGRSTHNWAEARASGPVQVSSTRFNSSISSAMPRSAIRSSSILLTACMTVV